MLSNIFHSLYEIYRRKLALLSVMVSQICANQLAFRSIFRCRTGLSLPSPRYWEIILKVIMRQERKNHTRGFYYNRIVLSDGMTDRRVYHLLAHGFVRFMLLLAFLLSPLRSSYSASPLV